MDAVDLPSQEALCSNLSLVTYGDALATTTALNLHFFNCARGPGKPNLLISVKDVDLNPRTEKRSERMFPQFFQEWYITTHCILEA